MPCYNSSMRLDDLPSDYYGAKVLWPAASKDPWVLVPDDDTHVNVSHHGWVELEFGVIDSEAASWFAYGQCVCLAEAMHARTGFPIAVVRCKPYAPLNNAFVHALLRVPDGRVLDINGFHQDEEILSYWERFTKQKVWIEDMSVADVIELAGHIDEMPDVEKMMTKHFADVLLVENGFLPGPWWKLPDYEVEVSLGTVLSP